jgi:hypothetical protein
MKISDIQIFRVEGEGQGSPFPEGNRQAKQLDVYAEFNTDASGSVGRVVCVRCMFRLRRTRVHRVFLDPYKIIRLL